MGDRWCFFTVACFGEGTSCGLLHGYAVELGHVVCGDPELAGAGAGASAALAGADSADHPPGGVHLGDELSAGSMRHKAPAACAITHTAPAPTSKNLGPAATAMVATVLPVAGSRRTTELLPK